jgi:hypothetical protein
MLNIVIETNISFCHYQHFIKSLYPLRGTHNNSIPASTIHLTAMQVLYNINHQHDQKIQINIFHHIQYQNHRGIVCILP